MDVGDGLKPGVFVGVGVIQTIEPQRLPRVNGPCPVKLPSRAHVIL